MNQTNDPEAYANHSIRCAIEALVDARYSPDLPAGHRREITEHIMVRLAVVYDYIRDDIAARLDAETTFLGKSTLIIDVIRPLTQRLNSASNQDRYRKEIAA